MAHKVDCPCGVTFSTPHGEKDAVEFAQWHVGSIHKTDFPNGMSREEALKTVKVV